jgi:hypothetical protein
MTFFTQEDLLLYLYQETSPEQTLAMDKALKADWALQEKLDELKASIGDLDQSLQAPRTSVILNVLNYARETEPATSH